jgi:signal transduction histidine kinase
MIIKAALHVIGQPDASLSGIREAAADIDEEVARLNQIVNEVLDFARPIRFELGPTDLNALCRDSAAAAEKGAAGAAVHLDLDPTLPATTTDGARLRLALINVLVNARHAVNGAAIASPSPSGTGRQPAALGLAPGEAPKPLVTLTTEWHGDRAAITISDRGPGIDQRDLAHVFDPYFTTRRGGSGLGLPIAKNIVEGLGGAIVVTSILGRGTDIRFEIPLGELPTASS